jgi:hypothetical protein
VRWFWWRVNAWCEVVAMISSFTVSVLLLFLARNGFAISTHRALLITIGATTVCWVATAWLGPETDREVLIRFYEKVRPAGPGWAPIKALADLTSSPPGDNIPLALVGWVAGCTAIWSGLFTVGNVLYMRPRASLLMFAVFALSSLALIQVVRSLWSPRTSEPANI